MTDAQATAILNDPNASADLRLEAAAILEPPLTLEETYGCDPWGAEWHGRHPASKRDSRTAG